MKRAAAVQHFRIRGGEKKRGAWRKKRNLDHGLKGCKKSVEGLLWGRTRRPDKMNSSEKGESNNKRNEKKSAGKFGDVLQKFFHPCWGGWLGFFGLVGWCSVNLSPSRVEI